MGHKARELVERGDVSQQVGHNPHDREGAHAGVLEDLALARGLGMARERVADIAKAVEVNAARYGQGHEDKADARTQRAQPQRAREQPPANLNEAHKGTHHREGGHHVAHVGAVPIKRGHGHLAEQGKRHAHRPEGQMTGPTLPYATIHSGLPSPSLSACAQPAATSNTASNSAAIRQFARPSARWYTLVSVA